MNIFWPHQTAQTALAKLIASRQPDDPLLTVGSDAIDVVSNND
jgi:hypothetical protein